jgi:GDP-D-mannose 3',5'-epimerase
MKCLVLGGGGFIGHHLANRLKKEGHEVHIVDQQWWITQEDFPNFIVGDLTKPATFLKLDTDYDEIYQLAADMGGAMYVFTKENDANIMLNSLQININVINWMKKHKKLKRVFFSSSACVYNEHNQMAKHAIDTREASAYPANPDSDYGWEKLTSERLYLAAKRNYGLEVRIGRYHNVYGPECDYLGIRPKSVAALSVKVIQAEDEIEIFGKGDQVRSFLYIDDCIDATINVMRSDYSEPLNIGSEQLVSINQLVDWFIELKGKKLRKKYIPGPIGVMARNSHNDLIRFHCAWYPQKKLSDGLKETYQWIEDQLKSPQVED